jgi:hypothetical protein
MILKKLLFATENFLAKIFACFSIQNLGNENRNFDIGRVKKILPV